MADCGSLQLQAAIGFSGKVAHSLLLTPTDTHLIYPLGSTIVIRNVEDQSDQTFLQAHTQAVTCMAISPDGSTLASGQITHMGYLADVILWDISGVGKEGGSKPELLHKLSLHKVKVQDVSFSCDGKYLCSLGGADDNNLVVWDVATGMAICGSPAAHDSALCCAWSNCSPATLISGGINTLRVWEFDKTNRKVRPTECTFGKEKRTFNDLAVSPDDAVLYAATASGDVISIDMATKRQIISGPRARFQQGILSLCYNRADGTLLVGAGDGTCSSLDATTLCIKQKATVIGGITSIALDSHGEFFFAGSSESNIYLAQSAGLVCELKGTNHSTSINDVAFPKGYADLFATCSDSEIRVWHSKTCSELLRISVPNLVCNCIAFPADGTLIISGWSDGKVRAFKPQSGCLAYVINDAHKLTGVGNSSGGVVPTNGVTAVCPSNDCTRLVTGGADGKVRVWAVSKNQQVMLASMCEHKGPISQLCIKSDDSQCVSASSDGSCIVWALSGLHPFVRENALFAANLFTSVSYSSDESQLLTCGTDRKITYYDVTNMSAIRQCDGSDDAPVTTLSINPDGKYFLIGGEDKKVSLWNYDDGSKYYEGEAHSGKVSRVVVSPDEKMVVSVGSEGAICMWIIPGEVASFQ